MAYFFSESGKNKKNEQNKNSTPALVAAYDHAVGTRIGTLRSFSRRLRDHGIADNSTARTQGQYSVQNIEIVHL